LKPSVLLILVFSATSESIPLIVRAFIIGPLHEPYSRIPGTPYLIICKNSKEWAQTFICDYEKLKTGNEMVKHQWQELICRFDNIKLHEFIVMPNPSLRKSA